MPIKNQKYAFVTSDGWEASLSERWPNAPEYGEYRLLVFSGASLDPLKSEFTEANFRQLGTQGTIEAMEAGELGPLVCSIEEARDVADHYTEEYTEEV